MLPVSIRHRLWELSGAELKVWLCYRSHANMDGIAWPGRTLLCKETGLSNDTVSAARSSLSRKRWLVPSHDGRNSRPNTGKFGSPRLRPVIPVDQVINVTDENRDGEIPSRREPVPETDRDGLTANHRDGNMPLSRHGENNVYRDGKTQSLSSSSEALPKELFPLEGGSTSAPNGALASALASPPVYEEDDDDSLPY